MQKIGFKKGKEIDLSSEIVNIIIKKLGEGSTALQQFTDNKSGYVIVINIAEIVYII